MATANVMLVTDDTEMSQFWSFLLENQSLDVFLTEVNQDLAGTIAQQGFDLIIAEAHKSPQAFFELLRELRNEFANPIMLLLPMSDEAHLLAGYESGVDECIGQPISPRLFLAKVKVWLGRSWTVPTEILDGFAVGDLRLEPSERLLILPDTQQVKLTNLEFRLLHLLMTHPGQMLESSVLVSRVWGHAEYVDGALLKNVVYRLRRKIEADPTQPVYIQTVAGKGYVFQPTN
jgi:DNA-binding response OmpR family regulator